jgi:hypothetical protein
MSKEESHRKREEGKIKGQIERDEERKMRNVCVCVHLCVRQRETNAKILKERERETNILRERQTDRQTQRQRDKYT